MRTAIVFLCRDLSNHKAFNDIIFESNDIDFFTVANSDLDNYKMALNAGYKNSCNSLASLNKYGVVALDIALFLFCEIKKEYDNVFFIEDDVFFSSTESLLNIINKCKSYDLCVPSHKKKSNPNILDWHWPEVIGIEKEYWHYSMTCICMMSRNMLNVIKEFVKKHETLFFHEAMFSSLAAQNNLSVFCPTELKTILASTPWGLDDFIYLPNNAFHKVNYADHSVIRKMIQFAKQEGYLPNIGKNPLFIKM